MAGDPAGHPMRPGGGQEVAIRARCRPRRLLPAQLGTLSTWPASGTKWLLLAHLMPLLLLPGELVGIGLASVFLKLIALLQPSSHSEVLSCWLRVF